MSDNETLATFPRTNATEARLTLSTFKGRQSVDLRLYFQNAAGEWLPSRKGCGIRPEELGDLLAALEVARGRLTP